MRYRYVLGVGVIVVVVAVVATRLITGDAVADAPRSAQIVEGRSMAGVSLGAVVRLTSSADGVRSGVLAGWGKVRGGGCYEATNCSWDVVRGGTVEVVLHARNSRVQRVATSAPGWRTARGIGRGSTATALRRAYGRAIVRRTTCGLNGFGGVSSGFVLNGRYHGQHRFTFFELSSSRRSVARVWIGRGRARAGTMC